MLPLSAIVVLWIALVVVVFAHPSVRRGWKAGIGALLVAYGVACAVNLTASYRANRILITSFPEEHAEATRHMRSVLQNGPDTLARQPLVQAALRLHERLARAAASFGPRTWRVTWRAHLLPTFEGRAEAQNLLKLVKVPPLLAYAQASFLQHRRDIAMCKDIHQADFPMLPSRTMSFLAGLMESYEKAHDECLELVAAIDPSREPSNDPRSPLYRLVSLAYRMVATQAKVEEILQVGCDAFDQFLSLRVVRAYPVGEGEMDQWTPISPFFMDLEPLLVFFHGVNVFSVRWMGDPPRPIVGSANAIYRLDCEVVGPWPRGQGSWTDPETGAGGPTYAVGPQAYQLYTPGMMLVKWAGQPDIRTNSPIVSFEERMLAGVPMVRVPDDILFPPERKGERR